ncbi:MAG: exo-alpha-sialidase [Phycisphaeraceae bacterium]|nr:exo-alpha-sialidase [Phycisphaeraceae bacterium]
MRHDLFIAALGMACALSTNGLAQSTETPVEYSPLLVMKEGLFDMSDSETRGLAEVPGTETITIFRAQDDTRKFANHPNLTWFKGHYYATWQATPVNEDSDDSVAVISRSADGHNWSQPIDIAPVLEGEVYHASGGWWTDGETLVCMILRMELAQPGKVKQTFVRTTTDGENWTPMHLLFPDTVVDSNPHVLPEGRMILVGHGGVDFTGDGEIDTLAARIWYTDTADVLGAWKQAQMPLYPVRRVWSSPDGKLERNLTYGTEPGIFERPDGKLTMVLRQSGKRGERTFRTWVSISEDRGQTWTMPAITNMLDSCSMQRAGNLPDGTAFMVNCPNVELRRVPLALTLSDDGIHLDRSYLVRGAPPPQRYKGWSKTLGYSYPGTFMHDGYLWIIYATNKEDVEVTRIPLEALAKK